MSRTSVVFFLLLAACRREPATAPLGALPFGNRQSTLQPGPPSANPQPRNPFAGDSEALAMGKQLYAEFNCAGCHAAGGGAIGPPLMDDEWIYGSSAANIYWTIIEGRPQGMPAFGGRISEGHAWRIAAYVRSLSGLKDEPQAERGSAEQPAAKQRSSVERGEQVFLTGSCVMCHAVRGTMAVARVGPDLTHLASRPTLAAGLLANTRGNRAGWILNPQNLKQGTKMPPSLLPAEELHPLLDYLETLQ